MYLKEIQYIFITFNQVNSQGFYVSSSKVLSFTAFCSSWSWDFCVFQSFANPDHELSASSSVHLAQHHQLSWCFKIMIVLFYVIGWLSMNILDCLGWFWIEPSGIERVGSLGYPWKTKGLSPALWLKEYSFSWLLCRVQLLHIILWNNIQLIILTCIDWNGLIFHAFT